MAQVGGRSLFSSPDHYLKSSNAFSASIQQEGHNINCIEGHMRTLISDYVGDRLEDHSPFCILSVGSGEGIPDLSFIEMLSKIRREGVDKCRIFQRSIEPWKEKLEVFRAKGEDLPESIKSRADIEFEWLPVTYQEYVEQKRKDDVKFDVVHFFHCLYYVGPETALEHCYEKKLGARGIIVCQIAAEGGAYARYGKVFSSEGIIPNPDVYYSSKEVADVAKKNGWKYVECPGERATSNITAIFDRSSVDGNFLLDFLTKWVNVGQVVSPETLQNILHYWENECFTDGRGRKLVNMESRTVIIFKGV